MAKRTKRKRVATSRSRSRSTGARGKATRGKQPARRTKATKQKLSARRGKATKRKVSARRGKATKRKQPARRTKATRTSASSKARARGRSTSSAKPRRRAAVPEVSERGNELIEIPTDPARFDSGAPPDAAAQARQVADAMAGDQEPGGSVMTPDHNSVDEWAAALGVERSPDSPVRSSEEILHERDERRSPGGPDPEHQRRTI
jgi:hypothetical protein